MNLNYRKKPVVIQAWQFTKENYRAGVPKEFRHKDVVLWSHVGNAVMNGAIHTLEGEMRVNENDWIIKGINGEFYPCKPDIFDKTYEPAE